MPLSWIPNGLTLLRCVLAFVAAGATVVAGYGGLRPVRLGSIDADAWSISSQPPIIFSIAEAMPAAMLALLAFALAAITDLLDGWAARQLNAVTPFGAWLDPIADKLLVGLSLVALTLFANPVWLIAIPAIAILVRDGWITFLRMSRGGGYAIPVSPLAKWKTALELTGIAVLLAYWPFFWAVSGHMAAFSATSPTLIQAALFLVPIGICSLWVAAILSLYTGWHYVRAYQQDDGSVPKTFE